MFFVFFLVFGSGSASWELLYLFKETEGGHALCPVPAERSGMWEHSAFFGPGFVFTALTQEARSGGASFM